VRIGELARLTGLRTSAIRYYEAERLLAAPPRVAGRRDYGEDARERLELVLAAQRAGFSLREIRELVAAADGRAMSIAWHARAHDKLEQLDRDLERIASTRRFLHEILACGCDTRAGCRLLARRGVRRAPGTRAGAARR
jgi:MerR family redox-sensitive transcriptional activator SoxR